MSVKPHIKYRSGYKYQLAADYVTLVNIHPDSIVGVENFIDLYPDGLLAIRRGYAWDGATCCPDLSSIMRFSLIHDALYQLMRARVLDQKHRIDADKLALTIPREDGLVYPACLIIYKALRIGAGPSADPSNAKKIITAP
jgi:hypothetical protein